MVLLDAMTLKHLEDAFKHISFPKISKNIDWTRMFLEKY